MGRFENYYLPMWGALMMLIGLAGAMVGFFVATSGSWIQGACLVAVCGPEYVVGWAWCELKKRPGDWGPVRASA